MRVGRFELVSELWLVGASLKGPDALVDTVRRCSELVADDEQPTAPHHELAIAALLVARRHDPVALRALGRELLRRLPEAARAAFVRQMDATCGASVIDAGLETLARAGALEEIFQ